MAITSTTTLAQAIDTEVIDPLTMSYLYGATFLPNMVRQVDITGLGSLKYDFNSYPQMTAAATTQGTDLTPAAVTIAEDGTVTAAEVGVAVEATRIGVAATGGRITTDDIARELGLALAAKVETDIMAAGQSFTASVGTTTVDFTLENFEDALATLRAAKAPTTVPPNFNLPPGLAGYQLVADEQHVADLLRELRQQGQVLLTQQAVGLFEGAGMEPAESLRGMYMGVKIYGTTYAATANGGADKSSLMFVPAGLGLTALGGPTVDRELHSLGRSQYIVASQIYGTGMIKDAFGVEIICDA